MSKYNKKQVFPIILSPFEVLQISENTKVVQKLAAKAKNKDLKPVKKSK